jgi:hypothetical protein
VSGTAPTVTYAAGYDPLTGATTPELVDEALVAAATADVVVFCGGLPARWSRRASTARRSTSPTARSA